MKISKSSLLSVSILILSVNTLMADTQIKCGFKVNSEADAKKCITNHILGHSQDVHDFLSFHQKFRSTRNTGKNCTDLTSNDGPSFYEETTFDEGMTTAKIDGSCKFMGDGYLCFLSKGPKGCHLTKDSGSGTQRSELKIDKTGRLITITPVEQPGTAPIVPTPGGSTGSTPAPKE